MGKTFLSFRFAATALLTLGLLIVGGLNIQQKRMFVIPDDGCLWIKGPYGVEGRVLVEDGPCDRAGVEDGDLLKSINNKPIVSDEDVAKALYGVGVYSSVKYIVERDGGEFESTAVIMAPPGQSVVLKRLYLEIIGIYFLVAGAFVLLKRF